MKRARTILLFSILCFTCFSLYAQVIPVKNAFLSREYVKPAEEKKFNSIIFTTPGKDEMLKKLKVELTLQNELLEWVIKVLVYEKEREDDERGEIIDQ